ncbi:hypothetical protein Dimus_015240 [Dionaea muscipula]
MGGMWTPALALHSVTQKTSEENSKYPPPDPNSVVLINTLITSHHHHAPSSTSTHPPLITPEQQMKLNLYPIPFLLTLITSLATTPSLSLSPDGLSLLSLKSAVDSSPAAAAAFSNWNQNDTTPCLWDGISCMNVPGYPDPRVVGITVSGRNLRGYIPSELGTLIFLRRLNLHGNAFYGSLPSQLFNATSLHSIFLYGNNLSGQLPPSICHLPRLQNLDVSDNSLSGSIPQDLGNCRQLQRLILAGNQFSGRIPSGIWSELTDLLQLDLSRNQLDGPIPEDLGGLQSLSGTFNLSFNQLSGQIPKSLGNLPTTVSFDLRSNNLSGEIPQTGSFASQGPTAFLDNPSLCGFPLQRSCHTGEDNPSETAPSTGSDSARRQRSGAGKQGGLDPGIIVLVSSADAAVVAFIGLVVVYLVWKRKDDCNGCSCTGKTKLGGDNKSSSSNNRRRSMLCGCMKSGFSGGSESEDESEKPSEGGGVGGGGELVAVDKGFRFELDELLRASAYVLGKSGLGIVYKVVLGNGVPVAVRRLGEAGGGEQQQQQQWRYKETFAAEMEAVGKVRHPNIVRLRAYYWAPDENEKLLISDFISNGNLATALRAEGTSAAGQARGPLPWATRLKIAKGTARGLAYLHECSPRKFVHGNIKPSNILLDEEYQPHISDFGVIRLIDIAGNNPSSSSSILSGGFMGGEAAPAPAPAPALPPHMKNRSNMYRAPEARLHGSRPTPSTPTQKWDVYSFGVVLLELLTGKCAEPSSSSSFPTAEIYDLVGWVRKGFEEQIPLSEIVDTFLLKEVHAKKEVLAVFHVALACTETDPEIRPKMKTASHILDRIGT